MSKKKFVSSLCILQALSCGLCFAEENPTVGKPDIQSVTSLTIAQKPSSHFTSFTGKVTGNKVRLRTTPSLEAYVIREANSGELLSIVDEKDDFYVILPPLGTKGYVFRTFVLDNVVEADRVNIRLYPDTEAPVIGQFQSGEKINAAVSSVNSKWLEVELGNSAHFYISKEYVENAGPIEMVAQKEARKQEAWHLLSSAFHFAQSEIQKPFEEIDLEKVDQNFNHLVRNFGDFPDIIQKTQELGNIIHDAYIQKKIYFLEFKADRTTRSSQDEMKKHFAKLTEIGKELQLEVGVLASMDTNDAAAPLAATFSTADAEIEGNENLSSLTDKMLAWLPFEESLYHMWAAAGGFGTIDEFYKQETGEAIHITGIVEAYNRPVKNRPGDYLLRCESLPQAFLYSTKVNLQDKIGKKVTIVVTPRPNHNFAFPAYFVHSIE